MKYPFQKPYSFSLLIALFLTLFSIPPTPTKADPPVTPAAITLPTPTRTWTSPGNTTYYIDSQHGSDSNDGHSASHAWRTLAKVNAGTFGPGDRILLHAGSAWNGFLGPAGSGTEAAPLIIDRYGRGPKPKIDAQGQWLSALYLSNSSYVTVRNLDIANHGPTPQPKLTGVKVSAADFGTIHEVVLDSLDIHDVTGSNDKDAGGGSGIDCSCWSSKVPTRFDGLLIQNCHLTRTDRNGITMSGAWARKDWYPSLHVVIRHNLLEDIGGDGIVPIACDGALIEYNILRGGRMRALDYAAGIWPWSCDNTVIQHNEVSGMKGTHDGEGFDSDWNCRNSLFQYNYSHDNDGGFMLICDDGSSKMPYNAGNTGTIIRYNISVNDGLHTFNMSGPCSNTKIYNNTIYLGDGSANQLVASGNWGGGWPTGTRFTNNVFVVTHNVGKVGKVGFDFGGMQDVAFQNNTFWGDFENRPDDPKALLSDPLLLKPGGNLPSDYRPRAASPCFNAGRPIPDNGGRDFAGNPIPQNAPPTVGAFQI